MRPEEYDIMVEKLADEIIGDVFEKEAAAYDQPLIKMVDPITYARNAKKVGHKVTPKDFAAYAALYTKGAASNAAGKAGKAVKDAAGNGVGLVKKHPKAFGIGAGALAATGATAASLAAYKHYKKKKEEANEKTAEEMIVDYAFEKEAAATAKQVGKQIAQQEKAYHKERQKAYNNVFKSANREDLKNGYRFDYGKAVKDAAGNGVGLVKKHPKVFGIGAGVAGAGLATGAGLAAYKHYKKKKEEAKEKTAAYWEDAMMWKEAAENVWAYASECEDEYDEMLLKNAAEEVFDEAEAQAQAAENVFDAIENDELDLIDGEGVVDDEFYEDYE